MIDQAKEVEAVSGLYQAAVSPERWQEALTAIMPLVNADTFHFLGWNKPRFQTDFNLFSDPGFDKEGEKYSAYYGSIDPRRQFTETTPVGEVFLCQDLFPEAYVSRSEFYQDFLIPGGHRWMIGAKTLSSDNHETALALLRRNDRSSAYSDDDISTARRVMAHVTKACHLWAHTEFMRLGAHLSSGSSHALFGLDSLRRIVHLNPAGEALLARRDALVLEHGVLTARLPDNANTLRIAILRVINTGCAENLALSGHVSGHHTCLLRIARLERPSGLGVHLASADVLITAQMRDAPLRLSPTMLHETFGLTAREAAVAIAIAEGVSPEDYAARAGTRIATVRTQLRVVFEKTQTNRQAELVSVLLRVPST